MALVRVQKGKQDVGQPNAYPFAYFPIKQHVVLLYNIAYSM